MNKFLRTLLILFCFASSAAFAQTINGTVLDETGQTMIGAAARIQGTTIGMTTNLDGKFTIQAPKEGTNIVEVSFIGYQKEVRSVNVKAGQTVDLKFNMVPSGNNLNEVVVIGYGSTEKKDLTGAVASVSSKDFLKGNINTPEQLISGKVAGVQITPNGGSPGSGSTIRIRGGSSLNASNDPLIVIDGVPLANDGIAGSPNPLSLINPNDIENMTILKDASATAIYGSRASNGVIIITTKKGKTDAFKVEVNSVNSVANVTRLVDVLSADEFRGIINSTNDTNKTKLMGTANTNWQELIYRTAISSDNLINFSGGIKKLPYRLSLGYLNQNGVLITDNMKRSTANFNLSPTFFKDHLKVEINQKATLSNSTFANQGAIGAAIGFDPTQEPRTNSDRFGGYFEWLNGKNPNALAGRNPLGLIEQRLDQSQVFRNIGNLQLDYKFHFLPELRANLNVGYDIARSNGTVTVTDSAASNYFSNAKGQFAPYVQNRDNKLLEFYLNYKKDLKKIKSVIDVIGGYSYQDWYFSSPNIRSLQANLDTIPGSLAPVFPFALSQNTLVSFYGRLNYTFNGKYLFTGTLRNDGSSRFSKSARWGLFPSAAFAWRIIEEKPFKKMKHLSDLKLRLGYGVTGQQDVGVNFNYLPIYSKSENTAQYQFGNQFFYTLRPSRYDEAFKWESTTTYNGGIDYGFFKGRVNGSVDVYYKKTEDLIAEIDVPAGTNFNNRVLTNVGSVENKGIEFIINTVPIAKKDLEWTVGFNLTANRNKILALSRFSNDTAIGNLVGGIAGGVGNTIQINTVGQQINTFYVYQQKYDENNRPIEVGDTSSSGVIYRDTDAYQDLNGDGKINSQDLYRHKNPAPRFFLGFNTQVSYKNWTFGLLARGSFGNYMYSNVASNSGNRNALLPASPTLSNGSSDILNTEFRVPQYFSDYYVQKAWFVRVDNINIGYSFGRILKNKIGLRVFATIQNAFLITKYKGVDPEIFNGIDNNLYPRPRVFSLGVNIQI